MMRGFRGTTDGMAIDLFLVSGAPPAVAPWPVATPAGRACAARLMRQGAVSPEYPELLRGVFA